MLNYFKAEDYENISLDNQAFKEIYAEKYANALFASKKNSPIDILKLFLNEVAQYKPLSTKEIVNYSRLAQKGDRNARNKMINGNLRLVIKMAKKYKNKDVDLVDLIQEGTLGLMTAVKKFNPDKGFKFSTYACYWIEDALKRALMNKGRTIRLPIHVVQEVNKVYKEFNKNENISTQEIAIKLNKKVDKIHTLLALKEKIVSYDVEMNETGKRLIDFIPDETKAVQELIASEELNEKLMSTMKTLSPKQKEVIIQRFGLNGEEPKTLWEIGEHLNLSKERIRQIEEKSLAKMKAAFQEEGIYATG